MRSLQFLLLFNLNEFVKVVSGLHQIFNTILVFPTRDVLEYGALEEAKFILVNVVPDLDWSGLVVLARDLMIVC